MIENVLILGRSGVGSSVVRGFCNLSTDIENSLGSPVFVFLLFYEIRYRAQAEAVCLNLACAIIFIL